MTILNQLLPQTEYDEVKNWLSKVIPAREAKESVDLGEAEHIVDYLNSRMSKGKKTRLQKMSYKDAKRLSAEWVEKQNKKAANIFETESDVEEIMQLENGLRLVKLIGENAYKREGRLMSHCVGSYVGKDCDVYSIRDAKNMPHCTIEIKNKKANQVKGKGNGSIHPRYVGSVLKALKHMGVKIRKSELSYLGYREISSELFELYNNNFKNFKYMNYMNSTFMYTNQKFERV